MEASETTENPKPLDCGHARDLARGIVHLGGTGKAICVNCHDRVNRAAYSPKVLRRERVPLKLGSTTLVGVMGFAEPSGHCPKCDHDHVTEPHCTRYGDGVTAICTVDDCGGVIPIKDPFPLSDGNCCDVINMNTENVEEAKKRWPGLAVDCEVEVVDLNGREMIRVVDDRLPDAWKKHRCSSCGFYEDDSDPDPYPTEEDGPLPPGYVYAPYVSVLKEPPPFDITEFSIRNKSRKLKGTWSLDTVEVKEEKLDSDPE